MKEIYIINNKDKLYNFFNGTELFVMIEIFFNDINRKIKPIKIHKYMQINNIPDKLSELYYLNNDIMNNCIELNLYNLNKNILYKSSIEIEITIIDDYLIDDKIKLNYSKKFIP